MEGGRHLRFVSPTLLHAKGAHWILILVTLLLATSLGGAANRIMIKAEASQEYVKQRALDDTKKVQTYSFSKGRYYKGNSKHSSMREFSFMDIVSDMAVHLQKQGYYNHPEAGEADLLIVVHYGVTDTEQSLFDLLGDTSLADLGYSENMDADAIAALQSKMNFLETANQATEDSLFRKAELLGMEEAYYKKTPAHKRRQLEWALAQARYFVILMAYDWPLLKQGETKLLWTTRYSIRALGQPFDQAIKDMNLVGGDYFGKNLDGLTQTRVTDDSKVEIGDIEVIEQEPE